MTVLARVTPLVKFMLDASGLRGAAGEEGEVAVGASARPPRPTARRSRRSPVRPTRPATGMVRVVPPARAPNRSCSSSSVSPAGFRESTIRFGDASGTNAPRPRAGVTLFDAALAGPLPMVFVAFTVNVYVLAVGEPVDDAARHASPTGRAARSRPATPAPCTPSRPSPPSLTGGAPAHRGQPVATDRGSARSAAQEALVPSGPSRARRRRPPSRREA